MSAVFKNAKRKQVQLELRKFMNEHKQKLKTATKIDSPLAKYNDSGQLTCILCSSTVRSESVWKVHINSKQHRDNVALAKKLKEDGCVFKTPKRPLSPTETTSNKKVKSILKNSKSEIPSDFFDSNGKTSEGKIIEQNENIVDESAANNEVLLDKNEQVDLLPEGFFDDPKLDAKARNLEYKDPVEEEWEKFQKEIKEVDYKSAEMIAEDQEEATTARQIDEIEEQMRNWSRVMDLERKKEDVKIVVAEEETKDAEQDDDVQDDAFDEFLDWRSKRSFR